MRIRTKLHFTLLGLVLPLLSGCFFDSGIPDINMDIPYWFNTSQIIIPFEIWGDGPQALAKYRVERRYIEDFEWFPVENVREIRVSSGSAGLLALDLRDQPEDQEFRLTVQVLSTSSGGAVPIPIVTVEKTFRIDTVPPDWEVFDGSSWRPFDPWMDVSPPPSDVGYLPDEPYTVSLVDLDIDTDFFDSFPGSRFRLHYTADGSTPTADSQSIESESEQIRFSYAPTDPGALLRFILIDEAGNHSPVITFPMVYGNTGI